MNPLPPELVLEIAQQLGNRDLISLHSTSRALHDITDPIFTKLFFSHLDIGVTFQSVKRLRRLACLNRRWGKFERLSISTRLVPDVSGISYAQNDGSLGIPDDSGLDTRYKLKSAYLEALSEQRFLLDSGLFMSSLSETISKLRNCSSIEMDKYILFSHRRESGSVTSPAYEASISSETSEWELPQAKAILSCRQLVRAVIAMAITLASTVARHLEGISLFGLNDGIYFDDLPVKYATDDTCTTRTIQLGLRDDVLMSGEDNQWIYRRKARRFASFLERFPKLEILVLAICRTQEPCPFSVISTITRTDTLCHLTLRSFDFESEDVSAMISSAQWHHLQKLHLSCICIFGEVDNWARILEWVNKRETLVDLCLENCSIGTRVAEEGMDLISRRPVRIYFGKDFDFVDLRRESSGIWQGERKSWHNRHGAKQNWKGNLNDLAKTTRVGI